MLRTASNRIITQTGAAKRAFASAVAQSTAGGAPSVLDNIVKLNFVDPSGARRSVPGYIGEFDALMIFFHPMSLSVCFL